MTPPPSKRCPRCRTWKPLAEFGNGYCRPCVLDYARERSRKLRESVRAVSARVGARAAAEREFWRAVAAPGLETVKALAEEAFGPPR